MMRRSRIIFLALGLALGVLVAATTATGTHSRPADDQRGEGGGHHNAFVRWDLLQAVNGVAVAGGTDVSTDSTTQDTIALTGSGQFEPRQQEAAGGGTFVHEQADGTLLAKGSYIVTGFVSWQPLKGGNFAGTGLVDGIGNGPGSSKDENEPTSGIVTLDVRLVPDGTAPSEGVDAVLSVHCNLPETIGGDFEGFTLSFGSFAFTPTANADPQAHGITLFHRLR